jgi:hypothetical protein
MVGRQPRRLLQRQFRIVGRRVVSQERKSISDLHLEIDTK